MKNILGMFKGKWEGPSGWKGRDWDSECGEKAPEGGNCRETPVTGLLT